MLTTRADEHRSLNWVLTHEKWFKPDGSNYEISDDYYGFFPVSRPEYVVKDLTVFKVSELDSIANTLDAVYYTDCYGIYQNEWVYDRDINERSRIVYGGMVNEDYTLMQNMYQNRKLILSEYNIIASPTSLDVRRKTERLMGIDFTGWTGRYYHSLDTSRNPDIPRWMRRLHERFYGRKFVYDDVPGLVLIHESNRIVVLQNEADLEHEVPVIHTPLETQEAFNLPEYLRYPFWFDITLAQDEKDVYSSYKLHTTERGDSILQRHGIPKEFPAVIGDRDEGLHYYFCGDFSDNPIPFGLSYFKGVEIFKELFYNNRDFLDRKKFFWEYYRPLIDHIVTDYRQRQEDSLIANGLRPLPPRDNGYVNYYSRYRLPLPDIDAIANNRAYDPQELLGTEYRDRAVRDSIRRANQEEVFIEENVTKDDSLRDYGKVKRHQDDVEDEILEVGGNVGRKGKEKVKKATKAVKGAIGLDTTTVKDVEVNPRYLVGGRMPYYKYLALQQKKKDKALEGEPELEEEEEKEEPQLSDEPQDEVKYEETPVESTKTVETYEEPVQTNPTGWHIIVSSIRDRSQAERWVNAHPEMDLRIIYSAKVNSYRIAIEESYPNLRAAQNALPSVRARFPDAWLNKE